VYTDVRDIDRMNLIGRGLIKRMGATIKRHAMWRAGDRVGVGVSGGSDSVALLRILQEVSEQEGIRLGVLHFNHGLRGADSEGDEQFVAELAARLGLPFFSGREDVAGMARARHWNLEDAARRLRYGFFAARVAEGRIDRVAVAHTADDQAETVLARVLRGTGPAGLAAIYPVKGHVVRPLLEVRRGELQEYLNRMGQTWREDASNHDPARLRSRLRHQVLPILEGEIQPAIVNHLSRLAALSREDEAFWRALTRTCLGVLLTREGGRLRMCCADLLNPSLSGGPLPGIELPEEARLAVTRRLVRGTIEELRGHCRQWTADHVERVVHLAASGSSGSRIELPGVIVERSFDWLWFSPANGEATEGVAAGWEANSAGSPVFSRVVELGNPGESTVVAVPEIKRRFRLKVVDWHPGRSDTDQDKAALDRDLLDPPLVLRNWRPGDSFRPKGRRSSRKLKQFLRMKRVAVPDREGWPVLTSANLLVWTRGLPVAAEFAPRPATRAGVIIAEENL
jgi:tRNA(Ile)-lysidine synthase